MSLFDFIKSELKRMAGVIFWPEFRVAWLFLFLLAVAFAVGLSFVPKGFLVAQGVVLAVAGAIAFKISYAAAEKNRGGSVERNELKNVLSGLEDALIVYDKDFRIIFFNSAAEKLFKLRKELVLGRELRPQDGESGAWRLLAQVIFPSLAPVVINRSQAGEYPQIVELSFDDPEMELRISTSPIADESEGLIGFMKIIRDRTREVALIKSKGEFLTVASHQLRTPVTDINWALQSLAKDESLGDTSKIVVGTAVKAGKELLKIVEDLLNITRIEGGRFGYQFEEKNLVDFIDGSLSSVATSARRAGVRVYFDKPKQDLPPVLIDPAKFTLAVDNLLENAIRYNVDNGEVIVGVEKMKNEPFLEVSIKDTGIGIPEDELKKLFTKFFRAENALKSQTEGSGLGLYIARNVVRAHGGKIWVESHEGKGSTFYFTLPTDPKLVPQHEVAVE